MTYRSYSTSIFNPLCICAHPTVSFQAITFKPLLLPSRPMSKDSQEMSPSFRYRQLLRPWGRRCARASIGARSLCSLCYTTVQTQAQNTVDMFLARRQSLSAPTKKLSKTNGTQPPVPKV
jgi:hypothetical protein